MSLLSSFAITKLKGLGDAATSALVRFDPQTASEADIRDQLKHVDDLANLVAKRKSEADQYAQTVTNLKTDVDRSTQAAQALGTKLEAQRASSDPHSGDTERNLNTVLDHIQKQQEALTKADADAQQSQSEYEEYKGYHEQAVQQVTTARQRLEGAMHDMERARLEQQRAEEKKREAERVAGILHGSTAGTTALDAMEAAAKAAHEKAAAANLTAHAVEQAKGSDVNSIVADALKGEQQHVDPLARLKAMQQQKQG